MRGGNGEGERERAGWMILYEAEGDGKEMRLNERGRCQ